MKKTHVRILSLILALLFVVSFAACGNTEPEETAEASTTTEATTPRATIGSTAEDTRTDDYYKTETEEVTSSDEETTTETSESETTEEPPEVVEPTGPVNYLTGLPLDEGDSELFRPMAFSINNLEIAARHQKGLSKADIIYEVEVEGGITRLVALFSDTKDVGKIGSVRSARPVMICIALGHDAYFLHAGGSNYAKNELATYDIPDLDALSWYANYFAYDDAVVKATSLEHGLFTEGEDAMAAVESYLSKGRRSEVKEGHNEIFEFYPEATALPGGSPCTKVTTSYISIYEPCFVYDAESGKYGREQYGAPHVDAATGEQLMFDNVIVLSVTSSVIANSGGQRDFNDVGSGSGILASQGTYINIKWEKASYTSPLVLTHEDGTPLTVNTGKTFISYVNGVSNISVSAE